MASDLRQGHDPKDDRKLTKADHDHVAKRVNEDKEKKDEKPHHG